MALGLAPSLHSTLVPNAARERGDRRERLRRLAWLASGLLHAVVLALLLGLWTSPHVDEFPPIEVALVPGTGDAGTAGGSGGGATKEGALAQGSEEPTPNRADEAAPPESTVKEAQQAQPVPPSPEPQATETPPAPPTPPTTTTVTNNPPTPVSEKPLVRMPPPPPRKPAPPQPTAVAAAPPPPQPAKPTPQPTPSPAPLPQVATAPVPQPSPGTPGTVEGRGGPGGVGQGEADAGQGIAGTGSGPGTDDYLERVWRHVRRFVKYPDVERKEKKEGTGRVIFRIERDGTVLDASVTESSGYPALDLAILDALHRASPVPRPPADYPGPETFVEEPFVFRLGFFDRVF